MNFTKNRFNYYRWTGRDRAGKITTGKLFATDRHDVITLLISRQIKVRQIHTQSKPFLLPAAQQINSREITLLTQQLATMLNAGLPLSDSLNLIATNHTRVECRSVINNIKTAIESGTPLSEALKSATPLFDAIYINLIASAEQSGQLADTTKQIAHYREKSEQQRAKFIKALLYPLSVICIAFCVAYLMLVSVLPAFEDIFRNFNTTLPWFTRQLIALSHWLRDHIGLHLISLLTLSWLLRSLLRHSESLRFLVDKKLIRVPILGAALSKSIIARFSRTLAVGVRSGLPVVQCIKQCSGLADNLYYETLFNRLFIETSGGVPIHVAMKNQGTFPDLMTQMVMIGEQSGTLDTMLDKIADGCESELDELTDRIGILIEPFLILFLGILVGGLVVAIYLPIFNMMNILE